MNAEPLISVIMPVYNAAGFLEEAVESIRGQTYTRWELFCSDDGSTDGSGRLLEKLAAADGRIRVLRGARHRGVAAACNDALLLARGELVARMDADDVSHQRRFEREAAYLRLHPAVVAVGGQVEMIDAAGRLVGRKRFPTDPEVVRRMMFRSLPVQQGAMMVARERLPRDFAWYRPGATTAEEVELLFRFLQHGQLANIEETVLKYRIHGNNVSLKDPKRTFALTLKARLKAVFAYGYRPTFAGLLVTGAEAVAVGVLPGRWVYPLYAFLRGIGRAGGGRRAGASARPLAAAQREAVK